MFLCFCELLPKKDFQKERERRKSNEEREEGEEIRVT
jgi:hypothetical protein